MGVGMRMRMGVGVVLGGVGVRGWGLGIAVRDGLLVNWGCHRGWYHVVGAAASLVGGGIRQRMQRSGGRVELISLTRRIRD